MKKYVFALLGVSVILLAADALPFTLLQNDMNLERGWTLVRDIETDLAFSTLDFEAVPLIETGEEMPVEVAIERISKFGQSTLLGQRTAELVIERYQELAPEDWKNYYILFPGTLWKNHEGNTFVPALYWKGKGWRLYFFELKRMCNSKLAILRSRHRY